MSRFLATFVPGSILALGLVAFYSPELPSSSAGRRSYGAAQKLGAGTVRTYIVTDPNNMRVPLEVGVAISEEAMATVPAPVAMSHEQMMKEEMEHGSHANMHMWNLELPANNPTSYKFVQFGWNPVGHPPMNVYTLPHFDFHFYRISPAAVDAIMPKDPQYAAKAGRIPAPELRPEFFLDPMTLAKAPAEAVAVPKMGVHWLDVRAAELQGLAGKPENAKPFTKTFIYGSWDGAFIFDEPMITREYILAKKAATDAAGREEIVPVPVSKAVAEPGWYPSAYKIAYDAEAKEYRIAMTQLAWRK